MRKRYYNRKKGYIIITVIFLIFSILLSICYCGMRPVILRHAVNTARTILLNVANQAILDVLEEENVSYKDIVTLSSGENGYITSIQTDITKINRLKSSISNRMTELLAKKEYYEISIPLGTFLLNEFTNGIGPKFVFKMQLSATPVVNFEHEFKEAGINNILHLVIIKMEISGGLIIFGFSDSVCASTTAIAAQTIIVGLVPDAITHIVETTDDDTAGLINDYGSGFNN